MSESDFFDEDLSAAGKSAQRATRGTEATPALEGTGHSGQERADNLQTLARQKEGVNDQVSSAIEEIERLRRRQETLERERTELEELRRKQEEYEAGKRELMDQLGKHIVFLEKQELQSSRLAALYSDSRARFRDMLEELRGIDESGWHEDVFRGELNRALVVVDSFRTEANKALAKIEAAGGGSQSGKGTKGLLSLEGARLSRSEQSFGYWLKVGFAITLPLIIALLLVFAANFLLLGGPW